MARVRRVNRDARLTPRQTEVTALIGGLGLSYGAAARRLRLRSGGGGLSPNYVRQIAREVKCLIGSQRPPREALARLFLHRIDELRPVAERLDIIL